MATEGLNQEMKVGMTTMKDTGERDFQHKTTGWPMLLRCGSWAPKKMSVMNKNRVVKKKYQFVGGMISLVSDILNLRCQLNTQADMSIKWLEKQICKQREKLECEIVFGGHPQRGKATNELQGWNHGKRNLA